MPTIKKTNLEKRVKSSIENAETIKKDKDSQ